MDRGSPVLSGAFVHLEGSSPLDRPGFDFLGGTDAHDYFKELQKLGTGDLVPGSSLEITSVAGQLVSEAAIPWEESPFSFTLVTGEPSHDRQPTTSVHILDGKRGLVWSTYPHEIEVSAGTGELRLTPGTPLAEIVGADRARGAALFTEFTIENAVTELR